jgi:uncharacterized protein (TIGR00730 family)
MNICVFCGSASGNNPVYAQAAESFGKLIAEGSHRLIYGGGNVGLMGIIADSVLKHGGEVTGVIPGFLEKREVAHRGLSSLEIVTSMHSRKQRMADLSQAFVAMPGGMGTLEELAEILTWKQLNLVHHPIGILNVNNFFAPLYAQLRLMVAEGFLSERNLNALYVERDAASLLTKIAG